MTNPRKNLIAFLFFISLSACAQKDLVSSSFSTAFNLVWIGFNQEDRGIDQRLIESIPYASSLVAFGGNSQSLLILEKSDTLGNIWTSSDNVNLLEKEGRIIGSIGLPNDLYHLSRPSINFESIISEKSISYHAYYSFRKPALNNLKVWIEANVVRLETIEILGFERELILVEERLYSEDINWKATDQYWVDPKTFFVWKKKQNISPKTPLISFQITKKPHQ